MTIAPIFILSQAPAGSSRVQRVLTLYDEMRGQGDRNSVNGDVRRQAAHGSCSGRSGPDA
jgi:hypothetical protein